MKRSVKRLASWTVAVISLVSMTFMSGCAEYIAQLNDYVEESIAVLENNPAAESSIDDVISKMTLDPERIILFGSYFACNFDIL